MNPNRPIPNETLDQIENEIRQIDQMMHSWSINRTLRFDPAHVKTPRETDKAEPQSDHPKSSVSRVFFWFNLIAFLLPGLLLVVQSFTPVISPVAESFLLTITVMVVAGGNLVLAAFESSRIKFQQTELPAKSRSNRNSASLTSNS